MKNMKRFLFPAALALVALPMFAGFAGPEAAAGRWHRVSLSSERLLHSLLGIQPAAAQDESGPYAIYQQALSVLQREYAGATLDRKKINELTIMAIRGMLFSLNDPFTGYLDRDEWAQMQQSTRGDFEGIGAVLEPFGRDVRVLRPIPDSPAFRAGIKSKDIILSVGEHDTSTDKLLRTHNTLGKNINDVVKLIKGPAGTKVTITVLRNSKPISFVITRAHIEPPIVTHWMEDDKQKIGRIVLHEFNEKSENQFDLRALVLDLRYNPGGLLNVAVAIGGRFVDRGPVVVIQEKNGQRTELPAYPPRAKYKKYPLVVLINESSASASEIVAGAIQDHEAGTLVGQHTFGKGLVQTLFPLSDYSALRLTTAKYFTPNGKDINNRYDEDHRPLFGTGGIKPDIDVKQSEEWSEQDFEDKVHDTQLQKALEMLRTHLASTAQRPR
jgi:carboxyl-terminal processing protease